MFDFETRSAGGPGSGNWGHRGRPGEVGGSAPASSGDGASIEHGFVSGTPKTAREAEAMLLKAMGKRKAGKAGVEDFPAAIAAAPRVASVLSEMREAGYLMPKSVNVGASGNYPKASTWQGGMLFVDVPENLPEGETLDDAYKAAYGGEDEHGFPRFAGRTFDEIVVHEMGHIQHFAGHVKPPKPDPISMPTGWWKDIQKVSRYGADNEPVEFVAEAFVRLYRGEKLSPNAQRYYESLHGPAVRPKKAPETRKLGAAEQKMPAPYSPPGERMNEKQRQHIAEILEREGVEAPEIEIEEEEPRGAGGPGSGYHGHRGRPGQVGGSAPADGEEREWKKTVKEAKKGIADEIRHQRMLAASNPSKIARPAIVNGDYFADPDEAEVPLNADRDRGDVLSPEEVSDLADSVAYVAAYGEEFKKYGDLDKYGIRGDLEKLGDPAEFDIVSFFGMTPETEAQYTVPHRCYSNAANLVADNPELTYVEGWGYVDGEFWAHGWAVNDKNEVIDPTWRPGHPTSPGGIPAQPRYFGVKYSREALAAMVDNDRLGILHGDRDFAHRVIRSGGHGLRLASQKKAHKRAAEGAVHRTLTGYAQTSEIRVLNFEGNEHIVVPVVALVGDSIVWAQNAEAPEFVPAEELRIAPKGWNGRPVVPNHPNGGRDSANDPDTLASMKFGQLFNTRFEGGALKTEAWLDPVRAAMVGDDALSVIARVNRGEMVEVSVGCWITASREPGIHPSGKRYAVRWRHIVPDHLAMLPEGVKGACSIEAGCGAPRLMGGPGSGNWGHKGRPGEVGGSAPSSGDGGTRIEHDVAAAVFHSPADAPKVIERLRNAQRTVCAPPVAVEVVKSLAGAEPPPPNLMHLQTLGEENKTVFGAHAKELKRDQMPQIPEDAAGQQEFVKFLADNGVKIKFEEVDPRDLMATQNELNGKTVSLIHGYLMEHDGKLRGDTGPLFVSKDHCVIDGHHRWASTAAYALDHPHMRIPIAVLDTSIENALRLSGKFDELKGIKPKGFGEGFVVPARAAAGGKDDEGFEPISIGNPPPDAPPKPDTEHDWFWLNGRWVWIPTDTADGVPDVLDLDGPARKLGGKGSGNFGHKGRPGEVGGSAPGGGESTSTGKGRGRGKSGSRSDSRWSAVQSNLPGSMKHSRVHELPHEFLHNASIDMTAAQDLTLTEDHMTAIRAMKPAVEALPGPESGEENSGLAALREVLTSGDVEVVLAPMAGGDAENVMMATVTGGGHAGLIINTAFNPDKPLPEGHSPASLSAIDYHNAIQSGADRQTALAEMYRSTAIHEFAHVYDVMTEQRMSREFQLTIANELGMDDRALHWIADNISPYAAFSPPEAAAEAFSKFVRHPDTVPSVLRNWWDRARSGGKRGVDPMRKFFEQILVPSVGGHRHGAEGDGGAAFDRWQDGPTPDLIVIDDDHPLPKIDWPDDDGSDEPRGAGGPGSGNFGHSGRPGQVGGSAPSGGASGMSVQHGRLHDEVKDVVAGKMKGIPQGKIPAEVRRRLGMWGENSAEGQVSDYHIEGVRQVVKAIDDLPKDPGFDALRKKLTDGSTEFAVASYNGGGALMTTVTDTQTDRTVLLLNTSVDPVREALMLGFMPRGVNVSVAGREAQKAMDKGASPIEAVKTFYHAVAIHEYGHVLDSLTNRKMSREFSSALTKALGRAEVPRWVERNLTGYHPDMSEAAAEAFSAFALGHPVPPELSTWWKRLSAGYSKTRRRAAAEMTDEELDAWWDHWINGQPDDWIIYDSSVDEVEEEEARTLGGPGSGNWGHAGRPGEVGGSAPSSGGGDISISHGMLASPDPDSGARASADLVQQSRVGINACEKLRESAVANAEYIAPADEAMSDSDKWESVPEDIKDSVLQSFFENVGDEWYSSDAADYARQEIDKDYAKELLRTEGDEIIDIASSSLQSDFTLEDTEPKLPYGDYGLVRTLDPESIVISEDGEDHDGDTLVTEELRWKNEPDTPLTEEQQAEAQEKYKTAFDDEFNERFERRFDDNAYIEREDEYRNDWENEQWNDLSDADKLEMAMKEGWEPEEPSDEGSGEPGEPSEWKSGLNVDDGPGDEDYERTSAIVQRMALERSREICEERGIDEVNRTDIGRIWQRWKGDSQNDESKVFQIATARELGGVLRLSESEVTRLENERGDDIARYQAYARAQWETTQWLLDKTGDDYVDVYRGLILDGTTIPEGSGETIKTPFSPGEVVRAEHYPGVPMKRNGLQSTTTKLSVANSWNGVGAAVPNPQRFVMRARVPRTSVMSVPVFGKNSMNEHEVVVLGSRDRWYWDIWRYRAPSFDSVPPISSNISGQRAAAEKPKIDPSVVIDFEEIDKQSPDWLKGNDPALVRYRERHPKSDRKKQPENRELGGPGSGNFGHGGRPGQVGGSAPGGGASIAHQQRTADPIPSAILDAISKPDGGFTYQPLSGEQPKHGFVLSLHKDRERVIDAKDCTIVTLAEYVIQNRDLLAQRNNFLGGWHNPEDDKVYLDVSTVVESPDEAERLGRESKQLAYFNLDKGQSVPIAPARAAEEVGHGGNEEANPVRHWSAFWRAVFGRPRAAREGDHGQGSDAGGDGAGAQAVRGIEDEEGVTPMEPEQAHSMLRRLAKAIGLRGRITVDADRVEPRAAVEPGDNETEEEFIPRCVKAVMDDGTTDDNKQAVAICYSMWRKKEKRGATEKSSEEANAEEGIRTACDCESQDATGRVAAKEEQMAELTAAVDRLIACKRSPFEDKDRAMLEALGEAKLQTLSMAFAQAEAPEPKPKTEAEWLAEAPESLRSMFGRYQQREREQHSRLVTLISGAQSVMAKDELSTKSIDELEKLVRLLKIDEPVPDYSGRALAAASDEGEYPKAPRPWDVARERRQGKEA